VGSSVNSSYEDMAVVGSTLRGSRISEKLISATATPGSRQILDQITQSGTYVDLLTAGVRMLEPACGPCVGMGQAPPSGANSLRTFNRNFPGRSGTADDSVYLCSPAVAAASMLKGEIADPRELTAPELPARPPARPAVVQGHILEPVPADEASSIEVPRGPNIKPPPEQKELPDTLELRVLIVAPDDISTGDLSPDGATVMAYRSNVPAIAEFTFQHRDPEFPRRAKEWGGGFIVAGDNYGQGSSRQHAALAPAQLDDAQDDGKQDSAEEINCIEDSENKEAGERNRPHIKGLSHQVGHAQSRSRCHLVGVAIIVSLIPEFWFLLAPFHFLS
jgi:aconitate hydratase